MERISAVIVTCQGKRFLRYLLPTLYTQSYPLEEIIVVDNSPGKDTLAWLRKNYPRVRVIKNKDNLLYAPSLNQGIRQSRGEFILCLNDDLRLASNFVERLIQTISRYPRTGMVCGRVMDWEGDKIDSCGQEISLWGSPRDRGKGKTYGFMKEERVFGTGGIAFLARRETLEDIGYMDEKLGIFYDDLDLAWRANKKGWEVWFNPRAICFHFRGGSTLGRRRRGPLYIYLPPPLKSRLIRNRYRVWKKNARGEEYLTRMPYIILYDLYLWVGLFFSSPSYFLKTLSEVIHELKD